MEYLFLFLGQFFNVFLLGFNSQVVRDKKVVLAFSVSWCISVAQFTYIYIIANAPDPMIAFIVSGFGGALGISCSIYFYEWLRATYVGKRIWK